MISLSRLWFRGSLPVLIGVTMILPYGASANIDYGAGKTPEQLFNSDCSECHHSPDRLVHGRSERSLAGFLREHYTTNAQWAASLANYLIRARTSNSTVSNWFLDLIQRIWRAVSASSWWLVGQLARLLPVHQSKAGWALLHRISRS